MRFSKSILAALIIASLASAAIADTTSRGHQWVRNHPFQVFAVLEWSVDMDIYKAAGFNSVMPIISQATGRRAMQETMCQQITDAGLDWHGFIGTAKACAGEENAVEETLETIRVHSQNSSNIGWSVGDENPVECFPELHSIHEQVRQAAPDALLYCALRGMGYDPDYTLDVETYHAYLRSAVAGLDTDVIMFDNYPFYREGTSTIFYENLALVRQYALEKGVPYWNWLQSHGMVPEYAFFQEPSESELRVQAFASLAYGYTGLGYWTYNSNYHPYSQCVIDGNGQPTHIHDSLSGLLPEVKTLGHALRFLTSTEVYYCPGQIFQDGQWLYPQPRGTVRWTREVDSPITSVKVSDGPHGFLLTFFKDDAGDDYFMIVNTNHGYERDANETAGAITIRFNYTVTQLQRLNRHTGEVDTIPLCDHFLNHYVLPGGTGDLFKIPTDREFAGLEQEDN